MRYRVTIEFYVHAGNERTALARAEIRARRLQTGDDNGAQVLTIETAPIGQVGQNKQIYP